MFVSLQTHERRKPVKVIVFYILVNDQDITVQLSTSQSVTITVEANHQSARLFQYFGSIVTGARSVSDHVPINMASGKPITLQVKNTLFVIWGKVIRVKPF